MLPLCAGPNLYANPIFYCGGTVKIAGAFDADEALRLIGIDERPITHTFAGPAVYQMQSRCPAFSLARLNRLKVAGVGGGVNIYPAKIERVLSAHADVIEAALIGSPIGGGGCWVGALRKDTAVSDRDISEFCQSSLASFKRPQFIIVLEDMPVICWERLSVRR